MKQSLLHESFPHYLLEIDKGETSFRTASEILDYLKQCIDGNEVARYIATYDHFEHTRALPNGQIANDILDAKCIVFCFGITLPDPRVMAFRPRSIGVAETLKSFVVTFVEAPMPVANLAIENWVMSLANQTPRKTH